VIDNIEDSLSLASTIRELLEHKVISQHNTLFLNYCLN